MLSTDELRCLDLWWRAANYLSVGQIYLLDNPLLREPLRAEHIKPRLLGHWGTTPGLNFLYAHLNAGDPRATTSSAISSPARATAARAWWRARGWRAPTASVYPDVSHDEEGMRRLFRQFSFPGGIPSHVAPETPGSIHEGGELGYALAHAYGAAFDNPDLLVAAWSATARPRPARWPRAGTRTSSSTRRATARCCRSCTSTATRSPTRRCSPDPEARS